MVAAVYCAALLLFFVITATCQQYPTCHKAHTAFCEDPVYGLTSNNLIFRCQYASGDAEPGNCNDEFVHCPANVSPSADDSSLADVPPLGLKYTYCWESSPTAGDAQCTYNCVRVTAANGTSFYPVVRDLCISRVFSKLTIRRDATALKHRPHRVNPRLARLH